MIVSIPVLCPFSYYDDFVYGIVNYPFHDVDVTRSPSYGGYISQLNHFARVYSYANDLIDRNLFLAANLLKQGYGYHKFR